MKSRNFKTSLLFITAIILTLGLSISFQSLLAAYTAPLANPATCVTGNPGCDAPISSGSTLVQTTQGALWVVNDAYPTSPYGLIVEQGKVGIGIIAPNYQLDVQGGQINVSGGFCIAGDCKTAWSQVGLQSETDPTVYAWAKAASKPAYNFTEIAGTVTDAQVPNDITINYAGSAGSIAWSNISSRPAGLDDGDQVGLTSETDPNVYAWAKAASKPAYSFSEISGAVTDAQVPDNITVNYAGSAGSITSQGSLATQSSVTDAQVPDDITVNYAASAGSAPANGGNSDTVDGKHGRLRSVEQVTTACKHAAYPDDNYYNCGNGATVLKRYEDRPNADCGSGCWACDYCRYYFVTCIELY